jgi:sugar phosphate isomerase/epimerase
VKGISVWRDTLEGRNIEKTGNLLRANGLEIVSLVRGGFFPASSKQKRKKAITENKRAIEEAAALGAPLVVLVCGAEPKISLEESRQQIQDGIESLLPFAERHNVKLGIEPLHPMYADTRSAVNTLGQTNDIAEAIDSPFVGAVVDVYHLWWDPNLEKEIKRCGKNKNLFAYHVCDWKVPTNDMLLDRGLMGEGCIDLKQIRGWVEATGYNGFIEVEIFSNHHWAKDQDIWLKEIKRAYKKYV